MAHNFASLPQRALLRREIHVIEAEAFRVPVCPLEIVDQ
jgi:hypothetical protein